MCISQMLSSAVSTRMSKECDFVSLWIHCAIWTCLCCFDAISEFHNHAQNTRMNMAPNHETSLLGHALPQTWWIVWKKLFVSEKNVGNVMFAALYCTIFRTPSSRKSLEFFGTPIASLDPETVQLHASYKLSPQCLQECVARRRSASLCHCAWTLCESLWNLLIGSCSLANWHSLKSWIQQCTPPQSPFIHPAYGKQGLSKLSTVY